MKNVMRILLSGVTCVLVAGLAGEARAADIVKSVALSRAAFNPAVGEKVGISYELPQPQRVTVGIYDPDGGLICTLVDGEAREAGVHEELWDGRDVDGHFVPDEAYLFTLETGPGFVYDPTTFSGGVVGDLADAQFDRQSGTVAYKLPAASRVLIRLGIRNGPMHKTLVDWKPRVAGAITEYWDGKDEDDVVNLQDHVDFSTLITYVTLPEATVIAYGNREESYRDYKLGRGKDRPNKPERPRAPDPEQRLRPEGLVPPRWARAPRVEMTFPELSGENSATMPSARDALHVRVDVEESDRDLLLKDQFEILFFVDNIFFAEAERGYLPYNLRWELHQIPPGEHVLTVNISSFKGQIGVASRKVRVLAGEQD